VARVVAYGVAMTWKAVRDVAEFVVCTLAVVTVLGLLTEGTLPSLRFAVQFTLGLVAIRIVMLVAKALWRRWRGSRARGLDPWAPGDRWKVTGSFMSRLDERWQRRQNSW
jgi:hypothetical protein